MGINNEVATRAIVEKVKEIKMFYEACNPNADYLTICIFKDSISVRNSNKEEDKEYPIDYFERFGNE